MADRNDIDIKVGVTGTKRALEELGKLLDSYQQKEKALIQNTHLQEMNTIKQKEANQERLHANRMLKLKLESQKVLENARVMSQALTVQQKELSLQNDKTKALAIQANVQASIANSQAKIADAMARASVAPGIQTARLAQAESKAQNQVELGSLKIAKETNNELKTRQQVRKAELQVQKEEVQLENAINNQLSNEVIKRNNIIASEERALAATARRYNVEASGQRTAEQGVVRLTMSQERLDRMRERNAQLDADRLARNERQAIRFAQQQEDRAARQERQGQGFFGGLFGPQIGGAIENLGRLNLAFMVVTQVFKPFVDIAVNATKEFAKYQQTMMTLEVITKNTGVSFSGAKRLMQEFNDGLSDEKAIAGAIKNFSSMGISLDKQSELINAMRSGIIAMGGDVNEQLPLMALAIKRNSSELLDNMGVTKNVDEMYKEYANTIGKTVKELNQQEKDTAVVNGVLKELAQYNGIADKSLNGLSGKMALADVNTKALWRSFGSFLSPAAEGVLDWFNNLAGAVKKASDNSQDLNKQLRYMPAAVAQPPAEGESLKQLGDRLKAVNQELAKSAQAGIRSDAPIVDALRQRGDQIINQINTIKRSQKMAKERNDKAAKEAAEKAAQEQIKNDEIRVQILNARDKKHEADLLQAQINFAKNKKSMSLALAQELYNAEVDQAERNYREKVERERKQHEQELKRIEREQKDRREKAAEQAIGRISTFKPELIKADVGATFEERRKAERENIVRIGRARSANELALTNLNKLDQATGNQSEETSRDFAKRRAEIEKIIKDQQGDISEHQRELDKIDLEEKKQNIKDAAEFMKSTFNAAYQLMQGDFSEFAANIGGILSDQIIKALSESESIRTAMKPMTDALVSGMSAAATAISVIITGISAFIIANPIVLLLAGIAAGIGLIIKNSSDAAKKSLEEYMSRVEKFQGIVNPAKSKTRREQAMEELPYWEQERERRRQALEQAKSKPDRNPYVQAKILERLQGQYNETEIRIIQLGDVIKNDLDDPMSEASKSAKELADAQNEAAKAAEWAAENIRKQAESTKSMRDFAFDLENKIFEQKINKMVREGKMTEEEGRRQKENMNIQNESMDLYAKARDMAKGFVPGSFGGFEQAVYSDAFQKFQSGDIKGMEEAFRSIGIDPLEQADLIRVWKNIEEHLTGRRDEANMPGSSPDKPMYTQVVNVRDFREAFPDSAYFRGGFSDTTRSTSTGMNVNTAVSKSSKPSPTSSAYPVGRGRRRTVYA